MQSEIITNDQIVASIGSDKIQARLFHPGGISSTDSSVSLTINFTQAIQVTGIATQGNGNDDGDHDCTSSTYKIGIFNGSDVKAQLIEEVC